VRLRHGPYPGPWLRLRGSGQARRSKEDTGKTEKPPKARLVPAGSIAVLYGALGELNEAFASLEKAYEEPTCNLRISK
jgi:hypothetical protein